MSSAVKTSVIHNLCMMASSMGKGGRTETSTTWGQHRGGQHHGAAVDGGGHSCSSGGSREGLLVLLVLGG